MKKMSLDQMREKIYSAFAALFAPLGVQDAWVIEAWEDHAIVLVGGIYYRAGLSIDGEGGVEFSARVEWTPVEEKREWVDVVKALKSGARNSSPDLERLQQIHDLAVMNGASCPPALLSDEETEKLWVHFGDEIKMLGETAEGVHVGGRLVRFSTPDDPDLTGDFFTAETDFGFKPGETKRVPVYLHHAQPLKMRDGRMLKIDKQVGDADLTLDADGVLVDAILYNREEYEKAIARMVKAMGWSSGALGHLMQREEARAGTKWIKRWIIGEATVTPTPAEPRNSVVPLKSLLGLAEEPAEAQVSAPVKAKDVVVTETTQILEESDMEQNEEIKALESRLSEMGANLDRILKFIEDAPALRKAGFVTVDGGKADPNVKSFADYLTAIRRGDATRLHEVYKSVKSLNEDSGEAGGYITPHEYGTDLMRVAMEASKILSAIDRVPVGSRSGEFPSLDVFTAPTAGSGNSALAGGIKGTKRAEAGAFTVTDAKFEQIKWQVNSVGGYTQVTNELASDSPLAIEALLRSLFGIAIASKEEYYVLRGNGVGEPLGVLNAPAAIAISPDTDNAFAYADAVEMASRFKKFGKPMWAIHQSLLPDFAASSWVLGNSIMKLEDMGYGPVAISEHLPQANASGCAVLVDWAAYKLFVRGGLEIAYSEHYGFINGLGTWRFNERLDGQPWMKAAITLADPGGSFTVSPIVYFND